MIIRDHIQRTALEWPTYGYRTITAELGRHYKTAPVNHKRILRMMREDKGNNFIVRLQRFRVNRIIFCLLSILLNIVRLYVGNRARSRIRPPRFLLRLMAIGHQHINGHTNRMKEKTPMPQFMLISQDSMEIPEGFEITPEIIQGIIQKYNDWAEGLQRSGHLVSLNKLRDEPGKNITGVGPNQVVTDGPYAETKEIIGGYWIITAADYDEAVKLASTCPSLEFGSRVEVREVEDLSTYSG